MPVLFLALTTISVYKYLIHYIKNGAKIPLKDDRKILIPVLVVSAIIGGWGGSVKWANSSSDLLAFFFWFFIFPTFSLIEAIRIRNMKIVAWYTTAVVGSMFVISNIFYFEGIISLILTPALGFIFGWFATKYAIKKLG